nr:heavy metal-binding domain-containing protein [Thermococcus zilligii]
MFLLVIHRVTDVETVEGVIVVTTEGIPGYRIVEVRGIARGGIVKATHIGRDIMALLRNIKGGEVKEYTEMLAEAREEALRRMALRAREMGANAVVGVRFATSNVGSSVAEVYAYGTAVVVEKE